MDDGPIDVSDLKASKWRRTMHIDKAQGGTTNILQCVNWPRLECWEVRETRDAELERVFMVDGITVETLEEAVTWLNRTREENERMAEERDGKPTPPPQRKFTLTAGIAFCEQLQEQFARTHEIYIQRGQLTQQESDQQKAQLAGLLAFAKFWKEHEEPMRELAAKIVRDKQKKSA
jgi:hypothetical protein